MSGIAGIIYFNGAPVPHGQVEAITSVMASRGPDGIHHWHGGSVALGQCMLRTTPESINEIQPLTSKDGDIVLVLDGRLDNRDEIRGDLRGLGVTPRDQTDAELVLCAYQAWGEGCPDHLLGEFAFAVWDGHRQKLLGVRDHFGARGLCYVQTSDYMAFASSDEPLLGLPGITSAPNEERIADYLAPGIYGVNPPRSWLRDVFAVLPGESFTVCPDGALRTQTYWQLEPGEESVYASDQECEEAFLAVFGEAVRCRLRTLGNPAAMMSGGMDSASISAMVHRLLPGMPGKKFHTYSAISDDPQSCVESRCILSLTGQPGVSARAVSVPSLHGMVSLSDLVDAAWSRPHPVDNSILLPALMCLAASRQGDHVLLCGVSGDLTMALPDRYPAYMMRDGHWWRAWQECLAASRNNTILRGTSPAWMFMLNAWTAFAPPEMKMVAQRLRRKRDGSPLAGSVIHPELADRVGWLARWETQQLEGGRRLADNSRAAHAVRVFRRPGHVSGLSGFGRVAARYGVELRDPWADRRVVEFFLRLPLKYKVRDGWAKHPARAAFSKDLAPEVHQRLGKEHVGWKFIDRLLDETDEVVSHAMEQRLEMLAPYADLDAVRKCYDRYRNGKSHADRMMIYELVSLIQWLSR